MYFINIEPILAFLQGARAGSSETEVINFIEALEEFIETQVKEQSHVEEVDYAE